MLIRVNSRLKRYWFWPGAGRLHECSQPAKMRSVSMSQFQRCFSRIMKIHLTIPLNTLRAGRMGEASLCLEFVLIHVNSWLKRFWFWPGAHGLLSALSQQKCGLSQCPSLMTSVHGGISPKLLLAPHVLTRTAWVRYNSDRLMSGKCGEKPPLPRNCKRQELSIIATGIHREGCSGR